MLLLFILCFVFHLFMFLFVSICEFLYIVYYCFVFLVILYLFSLFCCFSFVYFHLFIILLYFIFCIFLFIFFVLYLFVFFIFWFFVLILLTFYLFVYVFFIFFYLLWSLAFYWFSFVYTMVTRLHTATLIKTVKTTRLKTTTNCRQLLFKILVHDSSSKRFQFQAVEVSSSSGSRFQCQTLPISVCCSRQLMHSIAPSVFVALLPCAFARIVNFKFCDCAFFAFFRCLASLADRRESFLQTYRLPSASPRSKASFTM